MSAVDFSRSAAAAATPSPSHQTPAIHRRMRSTVDDVDMRALEGKLQLIETQRQLSAVRLQKFMQLVDAIANDDHLQNTSGTSFGRRSLDSPDFTGRTSNRTDDLWFGGQIGPIGRSSRRVERGRSEGSNMGLPRRPSTESPTWRLRGGISEERAVIGEAEEFSFSPSKPAPTATAAAISPRQVRSRSRLGFPRSSSTTTTTTGSPVELSSPLVARRHISLGCVDDFTFHASPDRR